MLIKRSILTEIGGFDESLPVLEDWKLWLELASKYPISYVAEPLVKYRVTPGSTSRNARDVYPYHERLVEFALEKSTFPSVEKRRLRCKALRKSNIICSYIAEDGDDLVYALVCALRALRYSPSNMNSLKRFVSTLLRLLRFKKVNGNIFF